MQPHQTELLSYKEENRIPRENIDDEALNFVTDCITTMSHARKQRKDINIIKIRGKKTRHTGLNYRVKPKTIVNNQRN